MYHYCTSVKETIDNLTVCRLSDFSNLTRTKMFLKICQHNTQVLMNNVIEFYQKMFCHILFATHLHDIH
jgi:hypothetical protein